MVHQQVNSGNALVKVKRLALGVASMGLALVTSTGQAAAQDPAGMTGTAPIAAPSMPPPVAAEQPARMVGGHIGLAVPLLSFHSTGDGTRSISDQFTLAVPIGISVHVSPDWVFDFETIVANNVNPWGPVGFTVDPGMVYVGGPVALGLRVKFDLAAAANVGLIPLVHKGIVDVGGVNWFIEGALPLTAMRGAGYSAGIVVHTGVAF